VERPHARRARLRAQERIPLVILGLSGGIDSAVCAVLAADALGPESVYCVSMPSRWSSDHSKSDAEDLAERIGLNYQVQASPTWSPPSRSSSASTGIAAENLQARVRAVVLMGLSNTHGHLVLTTGNKSELAVGYSTIYGDSVGGFAPIKDVPKSLVWELAAGGTRRPTAAARRRPSPRTRSRSRRRPNCAPARRTRTPFRRTTILDGILDAYVTGSSGQRMSSPSVSMRRSSTTSRRWSTVPSGSAARAPSARRSRDGLRPRPSAPGHVPPQSGEVIPARPRVTA
jgi:NAD+ synthase (glutamine-hydrolysing)